LLNKKTTNKLQHIYIFNIKKIINDIIELEKNRKKRNEQIKKLYIDLIKQTKKYIELAKNIPESLQHVFDYINSISQKIETKKVYKYPPSFNYKEFSKFSTYRKIRELMIKKEKNDLNETQY
jgi:hypothetical protein